MLGLDSNLDPVWVDQSGGGDVSNCAPIIVNTASGDIASFADGADNRQIRKIVGTIVPQQSGTGDPSPTNVRPISGWTGANIRQANDNLFDVGKIKALENLTFSNGVALYTKVSTRDFVRWNCNLHQGYGGTYTGISYALDVYNPTVLMWSLTVPDNLGDNLYLHIGYTAGEANKDGMFWYPITPGTYYFTVNILSTSPNVANGLSFNKFVISKSVFTTLPINWQTEAGTIYGGTITPYENESVDVVVDKVAYDMGGITWGMFYAESLFNTEFNDMPILNGQQFDGWIYCSCFKPMYATSLGSIPSVIQNNGIMGRNNHRQLYIKDTRFTDPADFKAAVAGQTIVVPLENPITYHFDNIGTLMTYFGTNNVWIDTGAITECDYPADTKLYIDGLTEPDEDMIADGLIASGKYFTVNNQLYLSTAQIAAGAQIIPGSNCTATSITEALNALNT